MENRQLEDRSIWRTGAAGGQEYLENWSSYRTGVFGEQEQLKDRTIWRTKAAGGQKGLENRSS